MKKWDHFWNSKVKGYFGNSNCQTVSSWLFFTLKLSLMVEYFLDIKSGQSLLDIISEVDFNYWGNFFGNFEMFPISYFLRPIKKKGEKIIFIFLSEKVQNIYSLSKYQKDFTSFFPFLKIKIQIKKRVSFS